jgi:DNA-binding XRE family transcriptional regulator
MTRINKMNNQLKKYRTWKNITQCDLSKKLGINKNNLRNIENNFHFPKYQTRKKLCDYFGVSQEQMFICEDENKC